MFDLGVTPRDPYRAGKDLTKQLVFIYFYFLETDRYRIVSFFSGYRVRREGVRRVLVMMWFMVFSVRQHFVFGLDRVWCSVG